MSVEGEEEAKGEEEYGDLISTELDRALRDLVPKTRTINNDGETTANFTTDRTAKYIAHGCTGHIESISIYCKNTGVAGYIYVGFRPYPDANDEFTKLLSVPANTLAQWKTWNIRKSWNMSRMFIHVISVDSGISVGYDTEAEYDSFLYDSTNREWYKADRRLYIRVALSALMKSVVPVEVTTPIKIDELLGRGMTVDATLRPSAETGKSIFIDTFSDLPLLWSISTSSGVASGYIYRDITAGLLEPGALHLASPFGVGEYGVATKRFSFPFVCKKLGVEFALGSWGGVVDSEIWFFIDIYTGSYIKDFVIRYVMATIGKWYLSEDNSATWVELVTHRLDTGTNRFHRVKLIVDIENIKYVVLKLPSKLLDLQSYHGYYDASTQNISINLAFWVFPPAVGGNAIFYIDDVVITAEE